MCEVYIRMHARSNPEPHGEGLMRSTEGGYRVVALVSQPEEADL
jgi:hypothetical protein